MGIHTGTMGKHSKTTSVPLHRVGHTMTSKGSLYWKGFLVASATSRKHVACCTLRMEYCLEYCTWNTAAWNEGHRPTENVLAWDSSPELLPIVLPGWIVVGFVCGLLIT